MKTAGLLEPLLRKVKETVHREVARPEKHVRQILVTNGGKTSQRELKEAECAGSAGSPCFISLVYLWPLELLAPVRDSLELADAMAWLGWAVSQTPP